MAGSMKNSMTAELPLLRLSDDRPFVIVDIETTGGNAMYGRIIDIAAIRIEQGCVVRRFQSLVNPERFIPPTIEQLTGITNTDVGNAPTFRRIAKELLRILDGAVFVAHNARFDYGFIKNEYRRLGREYSAKCLCTVKLSRKLFPSYRNHDLSSVIERHGIICTGRHRAMGDAEAVLDFLKSVHGQTTAELFTQAVKAILKTASIPPNLDKEDFDTLPETPGVYIFHGKSGEILYVGKSICIRDRVLSHFSGDHRSSREMEIAQQVNRIETRQTTGELGALLLESQLIKELRPMYNVASRRQRDLVLARRRLTPEGYATIELEQTHDIDIDLEAPIMGIFKHMKQAREYLGVISKEYKLCHKLLGLEKKNRYCFAYHLHQCLGACAGEEEPAMYNARVEEAFADRRIKAWPYTGGIIIEERDPTTNEGEAFLVDNWCLMATYKFTEMGQTELFEGIKRFDYDAYKILARYVLEPRNRRTIKQIPLNQLYSAADNYDSMD